MFQNNNTLISHEAIVLSTDHDSVTVSLLDQVACSGCHAEKSCSLSGMQKKEITFIGNYKFLPGSHVVVHMKSTMGYLAIFLGYLLPLIIFLGSMIFLHWLSVSELTIGLIALGLLIPYYVVLFFFRKFINRKFSFTLKT
jgi:positive regulator of sigma E activity